MTIAGIPNTTDAPRHPTRAIVGPAAFGYRDVAYRPLPGLYGGDRLAGGHP